MIHVVYHIYKSINDKNTSYEVHDIITHTDSHWRGKLNVTGGICAELELEYPSPEYIIKVSYVTSAGGITE